MLTPAKSKDFVVLKDSEEMLPSNRKVFGAGLVDALALGSGVGSTVFSVFALALAFAVEVEAFALVGLEVASVLEVLVEMEEADNVPEGESLSTGPGG